MPLKIFKELAQIPRPSSKEEKIVEYIKQFAKENQISFEIDNFNNVLLKKKTADMPLLILQAHTDMVCVSEVGKKIDFETQGITVVEKDGYLQADGTSLGADNGIGVAMALKLLQEDFPMNLEVIFTSEEETTMAGAYNFDVSKIKSKYMLNLDGSTNNAIDISSASSTDLTLQFPKVTNLLLSQIEESFLNTKLNTFALEISGFIGGHSGVDISQNRGNAFKTAIDFFESLESFYFIDFKAKVKSNELPTHFNALFATTKSLEETNAVVKKVFEDTYLAYNVPKLSINLKRVNLENKSAILDSDLIFEFMKKVKFGVLKDNQVKEVVLSSNLYEINLKEGFLKMHLRANDEVLRKFHISKLDSLCKVYGGTLKEESYLPGFAVSKENKFVKFVQKASKVVFKKEAKLVNVHAGLECGIFADKIEGLNVCVIGPEIEFMHSPKERVNIESVNKTYEWLKLIVKNFK